MSTSQDREPENAAGQDRQEPGREAPCGCKWTPGIDLPTTECAKHAADPELAHRPPSCGHCGWPDSPCRRLCANAQNRDLHWSATAEYVTSGDPRIIGEDDHGDWFVPSLDGDGMWDRPFSWWKLTHWSFWLRSRFTRRIAFLEAP